MPSEPAPDPTGSIVYVGFLGTVALAAACILTYLLSTIVPGSLVFSGTLLLIAAALPYRLSDTLGDRALSLAAVASVGYVPFIAVLCEDALIVPTYGAAPPQGLISLLLSVIFLVLYVGGAVIAFFVALPLGLYANKTTRSVMRSLAGVAVVVALALTIAGALRGARYPDPEGYLPSLPEIPKIDGNACPTAMCLSCPSGMERRPFVLFTPAGERKLGTVTGPCQKLVVRRDGELGLLFVVGDDRSPEFLKDAPEVTTIPEETSKVSSLKLSDIRGRLAPPWPWVLEAALGVAIALVSLFMGARAPMRAESNTATDARATARASLAFAAAILFATPLATACWAGLLGIY